MERIKALRDYLREVAGELGKVVWPGRDRTLKLTGVVVAMVAVVAGYLVLADYPMYLAIEKIIAK
jgi:preprotein translocase SecE subunit